MGLDALIDVYNPLAAKDTQVKKETAPGERENRPLTSWQDSASVIALSGFLKAHPDEGISLYEKEDGIPALQFFPGLTASDRTKERWGLAQQAFELFDAALDDIQELLTAGLLTLPKKKGN